MAIPRKRGLPAGAAPPPGAGSAALFSRRLLFCHPVQTFPAGVDGQEPAGVHHAGGPLAQRAGAQSARDDPLRERVVPGAGPGHRPAAGPIAGRPAGRVRNVWPLRRHRASESGAAPASGRPAGHPCHQGPAHPDDQDRPSDRGALQRRGRRRQRPQRGQTAGPHHPEAERRAGPRLHRELLRPLPLPAGAAAQGRTGAVHRGASGVPPVVQRGRAQPGTGPHPGGPASGRTGRAAGRPQPRLLRQKSGAAPQRGAAAHRADPQLHPGASAAQRAGGPQRQCGPRAGVARPAFER